MESDSHDLTSGITTPRPDPTEQTDAAIARLEKALTSYIDGEVKVLTTRLEGIDEATKLRLAGVEAIPNQIASAVGGLKELMTEKFEANERLRVEQKKDTKDAVDAALNAAKEAVKEQTAASEKAINKSEEATGNQTTDLRRALGELKDREIEDVRVLRGEITTVAGIANGSVNQKVGATESKAGMYAAIAAVAALFGILVIVAGVLASRTPT